MFPVRQSLKCTDSTLSGYRPDVAGRFRARPTPASASCLDLSMRHRVNASVASGVSHYCNADDRLQSTTNKPQTRAQHGIGDRRTPQTYAVSRFPARTRRLNLLRLVAYPRSVSVIEMFRQLSSKLTLSRACGIYFIGGQKGVGLGAEAGKGWRRNSDESNAEGSCG